MSKPFSSESGTHGNTSIVYGRTCILTDAKGEDPDDCTTHDHEEESLSFHWNSELGTLRCSSCSSEWPCHLSAWGLEPEVAVSHCPTCKKLELRWYHKGN